VGSPRRPTTESSLTSSTEGDASSNPEQVARTTALRLLAAAPRSRKQLADAMARKDVPDDVAEHVLDRFVEVGLIDDGAYAELLVRAKRESRSLGRRALALELQRAGISGDDAERALVGLDDAQEEATAQALIDRRWRDGVETTVQARRMLGLLGRKGYPADLAARLVRAKIRQIEAEIGDDGPVGFETAPD
jgi:regulatory protein